MLSPHEIATLILIAHAPEQVGAGWPDLQPLLNSNLVEIDRCHMCQGKPHVTPLTETVVVRFRGATTSGVSGMPRPIIPARTILEENHEA